MSIKHNSLNTNKLILIRRSSIHGMGVYAKADIPKGSRIIEYVGDKITKKEADRRADALEQLRKKKTHLGEVYIFELSKRYDIDGNVPYNKARYINHSCEPNTEVEIIRGKIWIVATKEIKNGDEIFYNYGYGYENFHHYKFW